MIELMDSFIHDVSTGDLPSCIPVRNAVQRHIQDLEDGHERNIRFDREAADRAISIVKLLKHTKGEFKGRLFDIQPYQAFIIGSLFGWKKTIFNPGESKEVRRFQKAYIEIARKNGKTEFAAAIGVIMMVFDGEAAAEVYSAATMRDQAKICWDAAKSMINELKKDSAAINDMIEVYRNSIIVKKTESKFQALTSEDSTLDGLSPHCGIIDEYHAHKSSDLLEVLETGMGARIQPLLLIITTAGFNKAGPCFQLRNVINDILSFRKKDDSTFGIIFTLDDPEKWHDENEWVKANPNIGKAPYWDYMRNQYTKAVNEGAMKQIQFLTKNLNIWTNTGTTWIADKHISKTREKFDIEKLKGMPAYGGLDLASNKDIAALRFCIPHEGKLYFWGKYYLPEETCLQRSKNDGVAYQQWSDEGYITLTEGNVTDYNWIKNDLLRLSEILNIRRIEYDRFNASQLVIELQDEGFNLDPYSQSITHMTTPTKEYEKLYLDGIIVHDGNPVHEWMLNNVEMIVDSNGNYKPAKNKSRDKIDGIIADIMALAGYYIEKNNDPRSVYEERGIFAL
jgi:phage terminase large subunit-like protein